MESDFAGETEGDPFRFDPLRFDPFGLITFDPAYFNGDCDNECGLAFCAEEEETDVGMFLNRKTYTRFWLNMFSFRNMSTSGSSTYFVYLPLTYPVMQKGSDSREVVVAFDMAMSILQISVLVEMK